MYQIGIIGTGIIAASHIDAIENTSICKVAAVVDIVEEKARLAALQCGCDYYTDYKKIDKSLDAVILNLPHSLHCEASCYFLRQGIHVLVEKPMANTAEECEAMIAAAEKGNARLAVGHIQRFFGANAIVKQLYQDNTYGKLAMTNERRNIFYFADSRPRWFLSREKAGGGIVMNYGAHALDKLFYILDGNVEEIHANCGNILNDFDIEGHGQIYLKFDNGISSVMTFSGYRGFNVNETTYYFADAAVRVSNSDVMEIAQNGKFEPYPYTTEHSPFEQQLIEFVKYMEGKESNIATAEYSANIIKTIERIYAQ